MHTKTTSPATNPPQAISSRLIVIGCCCLLLAYAFIVNAWVGDDAYISFRVVDNFLSGYGMRWNIQERVQVYTHPLWLFLMTAAYALTHEPYFTVLALSFCLTMAAFLCSCSLYIQHIGDDSLRACFLLVLILAGSKAFIDYTSSGLENPLSYALLALFYLILAAPVSPFEHSVRRRLFFLFVTAALAYINRQDTILLYLPALAYALYQRRKASCRSSGITVLLACLPALAWVAVSVIYYGFPFPNTAYAKLTTTFPVGELIRRGLGYFLNSLRRDPITLIVITAGIVLPLFRKTAAGCAAALGMLFYLFYILYIGGDFMSGRFFALPFLLGSIVAVQCLSGYRKSMAALIIASVAYTALNPSAPLKTWYDYDSKVTADANEINDERVTYFFTSGLIHCSPVYFNKKIPLWPCHRFTINAQRHKKDSVVVKTNIGYFGYFIGPGVHVVDPCGLSDPLLARIPAQGRIGHFVRAVPEGYLATVAEGTNAISDPDLHAYYDKVLSITRGPLFSLERWRDILLLNAGCYDDLIMAYMARHR